MGELKEYDLLKLLRRFISASAKGKHLQRNGKRIMKVSVQSYSFLQKHLTGFSSETNFHLRIRSVSKMSKREFKAEQKYWNTFYHQFTDYLYHSRGYYDNYTGALIKLLRSFFNYLNESGLDVGSFHKKFYVVKEDIQIVVLTPERLNYLIYDKGFETKLYGSLQKIKDIFVFGCTVALRISDLMNLKHDNLEMINERVYLNARSKKTNTFTRIKLPTYAIDIIERNKSAAPYLLPHFHTMYVNKRIKEIMELAGWTEQITKTRTIRGIPVVRYRRNAPQKSGYRFCDMVTPHTMRRTAITNMLCLGMNEQLVRKISGHAANSKDFFRYVSYAQTYMDSETDSVFEKLAQKTLLPVDNSVTTHAKN